MTPLAELSFTLRASSHSFLFHPLLPANATLFSSFPSPSFSFSFFCLFLVLFRFSVLFAPGYSITTDATDSSLSTSLLRGDISPGWVNNKEIEDASMYLAMKRCGLLEASICIQNAAFHTCNNMHVTRSIIEVLIFR